jgi:hypothetical protein
MKRSIRAMYAETFDTSSKSHAISRWLGVVGVVAFVVAGAAGGRGIVLW